MHFCPFGHAHARRETYMQAQTHAPQTHAQIGKSPILTLERNRQKLVLLGSALRCSRFKKVQYYTRLKIIS